MIPTTLRRSLLILLILMSVGSIFFASASGSVSLGWAQWLAAIQDSSGQHGELIWRLRLPRAMAAWVVGSMLALSGCLMQVLLRNPLADPYVLGVSGGAACATLLGMVFGVTAIVALASLAAPSEATITRNRNGLSGLPCRLHRTLDGRRFVNRLRRASGRLISSLGYTTSTFQSG